MEEYGNSINFYGTIIISNGICGHNVSLYGMPVEHKQVCAKIRKMPSFVDPDKG